MFGPFDGQFVDRVMLDHLGDTGEGVAELAQDEAALAGRNDFHVHEATGTPATHKTKVIEQRAQRSCLFKITCVLKIIQGRKEKHIIPC